MMIIIMDVYYEENPQKARASAMGYKNWNDKEPFKNWFFEKEDGILPYDPGNFSKRELPLLMSLLHEIMAAENIQDIQCLIVDGLVFLDKEGRAGLGKKLQEACLETWNFSPAVIGIAKTSWMEAPDEWKVYRGQSQRPLYVNAVGMDHEDAKSKVSALSGKFRLPDWVKWVDQGSRGSDFKNAPEVHNHVNKHRMR